MFDCEKCLCESVCDQSSRQMWGHMAKEQDCADFKDRTEFVEVVRCKDCKHWHEETGWCNHHSYFVEEDGEPCHPWESNNCKMLNEDDFCSYGERKDNT